MTEVHAKVFQHKQSAHCESGVVSSLVSHYGLPMSEPMAFGLASALAFAYIPIVKMAGMPLISYRMWPGAIVKAMHKRLGISMSRQTFSSRAAGVKALGIEIRAGLHTGEIALEGYDVSGLGVAIGARISAKAGASEVLVSQTVKDLVAGSGLAFEDRGEHELKGVPDSTPDARGWRLYRVIG